MKRILLVDDSAIYLEATRRALEAAGYAVVCASDLSELAEVRTRGVFDLVLMDVQMPEAFGDDVAMILRDSHGLAARSYLVSALDERDLAERVAWSGVDGYISKNVGLTEIVAQVVAILEAPQP
jgi:CheY-like chemotaxis protein